MANHKSKASKLTEKSGVDPIQFQDDLELTIQKVICENQVDIAEKMQPNNGNTRDDIARKYDAFLKSISQIMADNQITDIDVCHLIDPHSANYPGYAFLELTPDGLVANYHVGSIKVDNVLDVLDYLDEPKQILRSLIHAIINGTDVNERIMELESCLESTQKAIKNFNITSEPDNRIANDKNNLNIRNDD